MGDLLDLPARTDRSRPRSPRVARCAGRAHARHALVSSEQLPRSGFVQSLQLRSSAGPAGVTPDILMACDGTDYSVVFQWWAAR